MTAALDRQALNRATLDRQFLLRRTYLPVPDVLASPTAPPCSRSSQPMPRITPSRSPRN
jgi:hypothetical protein